MSSSTDSARQKQRAESHRRLHRKPYRGLRIRRANARPKEMLKDLKMLSKLEMLYKEGFIDDADPWLRYP